jgi:hypothetical protein
VRLSARHPAPPALSRGTIGCPAAPCTSTSWCTGSSTTGRRCPLGLPRHWLPDTVEALADDNLPTDEIATADGVVTAAAVAVAETGTVILDATADQGRRVITLLPDVHICVLRTDQVVAGVPDALARLDPTVHSPGSAAPPPRVTSNSTGSRASTAPATCTW